MKKGFAHGDRVVIVKEYMGFNAIGKVGIIRSAYKNFGNKGPVYAVELVDAIEINKNRELYFSPYITKGGVVPLNQLHTSGGLLDKASSWQFHESCLIPYTGHLSESNHSSLLQFNQELSKLRLSSHRLTHKLKKGGEKHDKK